MAMTLWSPICLICKHSLYCPTERGYRCAMRHHKLISSVMECENFKHRSENFIEEACSCRSCREKDAEIDNFIRHNIPMFE